MKKLLVIILLTVGVHAFAGHQTKSFLIQFASDEHELDPVALKRLEEVNAYLKEHPTAKIKLTGRTDFDGTVGYNLVLSRLRTTEVSEFLKTKGWKNAEINEKWVGELKPIAPNKDDEGKALNRSVEILVTMLNYDNAADWLKEQQEGYEEVFKLKNSGQNTITTDNETVITIPAGSFIGPDGKLIDNKNVKVVIKEVNTTLDAILNQVSTMAGEQLLETGGMINIAAYSNTTQLEMADGKEISVQIPTKTDKPDMFVFEGVLDKNGNIDWKNTGKPFATNGKFAVKPTKLNETILQSLISSIELDHPTYNDLNLQYTLPKYVKMPSLPKAPKIPEKQDAKKLFSSLGWLLSSPKMRAKKVDKLYKSDMATYSQRKASYDKRMDNYTKAMANYEANKEILEIERQKFENWVENCKTRVGEEKETWKDYYDKKRVAHSLTELKNASKNGTLISNYPMGIFKNNAMQSKNMEAKTEIKRLQTIEYILNAIADKDFNSLRKNFSKDDELDVFSLANHLFKGFGEGFYLTENYTNDFLDTFISANKNDMEKVFGDEATNQLRLKENQKQMNEAASAQNYFSGNAKKMGWINCDRFVNQPMVRINTTLVPGACQLVILKNINSIIGTSIDPLRAESFAKIPQNSKFKLVTLKIEGDQGYIAVSEATAQNGLKLEPEFRKIPLDDLSQMLAKL